jgi:hypothetical protein
MPWSAFRKSIRLCGTILLFITKSPRVKFFGAAGKVPPAALCQPDNRTRV